MRNRIRGCFGSGPLPHPATHESILPWVAGWGSGLVPLSEDAHPSTGGHSRVPTVGEPGACTV